MASKTSAPSQTQVDFGYSFATPHRLTVALPNSCNKTLLDVSEKSLRMAWTYETLDQFPLFSFATPTTRWEIVLTPTIDGHPFARSHWNRVDGYLPILESSYQDGRGVVKILATGGETAAILRITVTNTGDCSHCFEVSCEKPGSWAGMNPAWVDEDAPANALMAGWLDRADRLLVLADGATDYPVRSATSTVLRWQLKAGESRTGWIVRPYKAYADDIPTLLKVDWALEYARSIDVWRELLAGAVQPQIPDAGVRNAYLACLADLFIMRENLATGHIVGTPGTEVYRAPNSYEAGIMAIALDQVGLHEESRRGFELPLQIQEPNGNWTEPHGWAHTMWGGSGFKSWVVMQHYLLTGDRDYLETIYPRMVSSSRWQAEMRRKTKLRTDKDALTYGLMPRGMGDCGLKDDDDLYGVFIPHNIWAVYADKLALETAKLLGRADEIAELDGIYSEALTDLLSAIRRGAISESGYAWIPGVPGKRSGSRWGVLNAAYPCGLLALDDPLIDGTLRHIEAHLSPGGVPINTGWMTDGMWVAITLDNIAEVHLARQEGDKAAEYLYAVLNHGTPLYTWCEERGQEPYTSKTTGDRQHLWTPVAVVRALRDMFVMEQGSELHLGLGLPRAWLASGEAIGIAEAPTYFGQISYLMTYNSEEQTINGYVNMPTDRQVDVVLHLRLPAGMHAHTTIDGKECASDGESQFVRWVGASGKYGVSLGVLCDD